MVNSTTDRPWLSSQAQSAQALAGLVFGLAVGCAFTMAMMRNPAIALVMMAAVPVALAVVLKPELGYALFIFLILVIEEFPSGMGEVVERSQRTPFYSKSLGVPGLYSTDALLFGLLGLYLAYRAIQGKRLIYVDAMGAGLAVIMACLGLTAVVSLLAGDPFEAAYYLEEAGTGYEVNLRGAMLIAFFQYKIFLYLLLTYWLTSLYLESPRQLRSLLVVVAAAAAANAVIGVVRLATNPDIIPNMYPLFYHSPSSWIFALVAFYTVLAWSYGLLTHRQTVLLMLLSGVLMFWVLISFRRTMWGAIVFVAPLLLVYVHPRQRLRFLVIGSAGLGLALAAAFGLPGLRDVTGAVGGRIEATSAADPSTLYRLAMFNYFALNWMDVPLLGYGVTPMWNMYSSLSPYFRINLENIHSLYFWWLLRMGPIGLFVALTCVAAILGMIVRFVRNTSNYQYRVLGVCTMMALAMMLFSGIVNPVYGEARYTIVMGTMLAMVSRMAHFEGIKLASLRGAARPRLDQPAGLRHEPGSGRTT